MSTTPAMMLAYGLQDAATAMGISRTTLWRLIVRGEIATFKIGARTLIATETLKAFIQRARGTVSAPDA